MERFNQDWKDVLAKPAYRRVKTFHANVFFNRAIITNPKDNPYLDWSEAKARAFLDELLGVIHKRKIMPVGSVVDVQAFKSYSFGEQCVMAGYIPEPAIRKHRITSAPYHLAMRILVQDALTKVAPTTELHFVIAEQRELQQRALDGYYQAKELWAQSDDPMDKQHAAQLRGMTPEGQAYFPALQAADLFANRWFNTSNRRWQTSKENKRIMAELCRRRDDIPFIDRLSMKRMWAELPAWANIQDRIRSLKESDLS